jgi:hypothetical protein
VLVSITLFELTYPYYGAPLMLHSQITDWAKILAWEKHSSLLAAASVMMEESVMILAPDKTGYFRLEPG